MHLLPKARHAQAAFRGSLESLSVYPSRRAFCKFHIVSIVVTSSFFELGSKGCREKKKNASPLDARVIRELTPPPRSTLFLSFHIPEGVEICCRVIFPPFFFYYFPSLRDSAAVPFLGIKVGHAGCPGSESRLSRPLLESAYWRSIAFWHFAPPLLGGYSSLPVVVVVSPQGGGRQATRCFGGFRASGCLCSVRQSVAFIHFVFSFTTR